MKSHHLDDIDCICKYCEHASSLYSNNEMICIIKGVVSSEHHCRKFSYDPLKREPRKMKLDIDGLEFPDINE